MATASYIDIVLNRYRNGIVKLFPQNYFILFIDDVNLDRLLIIIVLDEMYLLCLVKNLLPNYIMHRPVLVVGTHGNLSDVHVIVFYAILEFVFCCIIDSGRN